MTPPDRTPSRRAGAQGTPDLPWTTRAWAHARLMRPANSLTAALGVLAGIALATYHTWPTSLWFAATTGARAAVWVGAPLAAFAITAAGNIANDIADVAIDRTAHPRRPLPQGHVTKLAASVQAAVLLALGLAAAAWAGGTPLFAFAACNAAALAWYEMVAKSRGLLGNLLVAALVGSTVAFGGYAWSGPIGLQAALPLAAMAALANLAREVVKDVEDAQHDRATRRTVPIAWGGGTASTIATVALAVAVAYALVDAHQNRNVPVAYLAPAVALFAAGAILAWPRPALGQRAIKVAMLAALAAYLAPGLVRL